MNYTDINPYIRFSATQNLAKTSLYLAKGAINYDHRIYYCVEGKGIITINGVKYEIEPGSFLMWRSGSKYTCRPLTNDFICITCNFDFFTNENTIKTPIVPAINSEYKEEIVIEKDVHFKDNEIFNNIVYIRNFLQVDDLLKKLVKTFRENFKFYEVNGKAILLHIFDKVINYKNSQESEKTKVNLYNIVTYIHEHYKDDLSNEFIAEKYSYHPNYLSQLFYEKTGYSLHNYIIRYRLSRAVKKLMSSDMSIKEICEYVNISDQHYFSRIFKKYYGVTPQQMRKNKL